MNPSDKITWIFCEKWFGILFEFILIKNKTMERFLPFMLGSNGSNFRDFFYEDDVMVFEVPGFTKEDLEINLDGRTMEIKGKKEILNQTKEIERRFLIPSDYVYGDNPITAKVKDGILYVNLNKDKKKKQTKVIIS